VRTQGVVAFDAAVRSGRGVDYDAIAARLIGSLFVLFLVRIMLQVYRAERRYAAFYEELFEAAPVAAPYEWLTTVANRFQGQHSKGDREDELAAAWQRIRFLCAGRSSPC
jgi:hypothetical protein